MELSSSQQIQGLLRRKRHQARFLTIVSPAVKWPSWVVGRHLQMQPIHTQKRRNTGSNPADISPQLSLYAESDARRIGIPSRAFHRLQTPNNAVSTPSDSSLQTSQGHGWSESLIDSMNWRSSVVIQFLFALIKASELGERRGNC